MKFVFKAFLCLVVMATAVTAQNLVAQNKAVQDKAPKASTTGMPPLVDREIFFGNPEIAGAQISPDGKYLSFLKPWKDTRNVYVKGVDEPFEAARLLTTEAKRPVAGYFWTRDSKYILYVKDKDGDENYNVYAVDPAAKPAAGADAPASRDLTGVKGVRVQIYSLPKNDPDVAYIGLNDRDKAYHDLYKLKISTGEKTLVRQNTEKISAWVFDTKGNLRLATRTADNGDNETLRVDADKFTLIYSCSVFESCGPARFQKDGKLVYFETNKGDDVNLSALTLLDPATGKTQMVESDPLHKVDFGNAVFSDATDELVMTTYDDAKVRRYYKDKGYEADYKLLEGKLPNMEVSIASRTLDDQKWIVAAHSDVEPGVSYLFDRKTKKLTQTVPHLGKTAA